MDDVEMAEPSTAPPTRFSTAQGKHATDPTVALPNVLDLDVSSDLWTNLLTYQLQGCGCRIGMKKAKSVMTTMCATIVILMICCAGGLLYLVQFESEPNFTADLPPCDETPCAHGAECIEDPTSRHGYFCDCSTDRYIGSDCEIDLQTCSSVCPTASSQSTAKFVLLTSRRCSGPVST